MRRGMVVVVVLIACEAIASADSFTLRLEYDSFFRTYPTVGWVRPCGDGSESAWWGSFVAYVDYETAELDVGWSRAIGPSWLSPGIGVTFGTSSWGLSGESKQRIARDVVPSLTVSTRSETFELEGYNAAWIPIQEDHDTAVWFAQSRWYAALKSHELGAGPHVELLFTKEGASDLRLTHLWLGAHVVKNWPRTSFQLFLGWDPIELDEYFAAPKQAGAAFRVTFVREL